VFVPTTTPITESNLLFENMTAENISLIVETYAADSVNSSNETNIQYFQQIKVPGNCYVPWVSLYIQYIHPFILPEDWIISIYNATPNLFSLKPTPGSEIENSNVSIDPSKEEEGLTIKRLLSHWENVTLPNVFLNTSETYFYDGYYHFFLSVLMPKGNGDNHFWFYSLDDEGLGEDYGSAFASLTFLGPDIGMGGNNDNIRLVTVEIPNIDFALITKLVPANHNPKPSDIGLTVNGKAVQDISNGSGSFDSKKTLIPIDNRVTFEIESRWSNLSPGAISFDILGNFNLGEEIVGDVKAEIHQGSDTINWTIDYTVDYIQQVGNETAQLEAKIPVSWTFVSAVNMTGTNNSVHGSSTVTYEEPYKYRTVLIGNITTGDWRLYCTSALVDGVVNLNTTGGNINYDQDLTGNVTVVDGPNGKTDSIRSDLEGGIYNMSVLSGYSSTTKPVAAAKFDDQTILFTNISTGSFEELYQKAAAGEILVNSTIASEFDLYVDTTTGFLEDNIEEIQFIMNHESFNKSWWFAYIDNATMPENPDHWNLDSATLAEVQEKLLDYDFNGVLTNFTYNQSENRYSDIYFNLSARVAYNQTYISREKIEDLFITIVSNFSIHDNIQSLFIKNQSDGTLYELQELKARKGYLNDTILTWSSADETTMRNLTEFINSNNNTLEFMLRSENSTNVTIDPQGYTIRLDTCALSFNYTNYLENYTVSVYNWTAGAYSSTTLDLSGGIGKLYDKQNLSTLFPALQSMFNEDNHSVRIKIETRGEIPLINQISWQLNRIMINVSYTYYTSFNWTDSILSSTGSVLYSSSVSTLFDSPLNNHSLHVGINDILTYTDEYIHEIIWSNGTDIMAIQTPFNVSRIETKLELITGDGKESLIVGSNLVIGGKLTYNSNGSAIVNKTITLVLVIKYENNSEENKTFTGNTNDEGTTSITLQVNETWNTISFKLLYSDDDPRFKTSSSSTSRIITIITQLEHVLGIVMDNILYIVIAATVIVALGVYKRSINTRNKRKWAHDSDKIRDIVKIQHLLVIMKNSGACIVNRAYSKMQLDADLISGFLQAIATFGKEIGPRKESKEGDGMIFDYQNFKILIRDGKYVRVALILDGVPTDNLKQNMAQFIQAFENRYKLAEWRGNLAEFTNVDVLIENAFEITLIYPLVISKGMGKKDIKSDLGKNLFEVAEAVQAEKQAFYLSTLLNYAQAGRKESQEHVLSEIYHLKKNGAFTIYHPPVQNQA
ncbi:MAG: hypothetical protein ACTSU9_17575, partial [Promethearchaeota archaeon]